MTIQKRKSSSNAKKAQLLPGMADILAGVDPLWDLIFRKLQKYGRSFGFTRVETPLLESAALYDYDSQKNLVSFMDAAGDRVAVRADALPGIMRAYVDKKIYETQKLAKWYYLQPTVTYDQKLKDFQSSWQYGFELYGEFPALIEVQLMTAVWKFFKSLGLEELIFEINSIGKSSERADYTQALVNFLQTKKYELCNDCVASIDDQPLQIFRCQNPSCQAVAADAPQALDYLSEESHKHFTLVLETLDEIGIVYNLNPVLVGREGSSRTVFTLKYKHNEKDLVLGEGSFHQDMIKHLTGKEFPCFGFTGNFEVLVDILSQLQTEVVSELRAEVFLAPLGELAAKKALRLFAELWDENIYVHDNFGEGGVKNQLKLAEGSKAVIALIIGQKEAMDDLVILRDVKSGMQEVFQYERIVEEVKKRLGR